jgi:hypothetical protein
MVRDYKIVFFGQVVLDLFKDRYFLIEKIAVFDNTAAARTDKMVMVFRAPGAL